MASSQQSGAGNFLLTLVLLGLAIASFYMGMATRHKAQTGQSLWEALFGGEPAKTAPTPAE